MGVQLRSLTGAFRDCSSLTAIEIPNSVTSIGFFAFEGCDNLSIFCETESELSGWEEGWNHDNRPVYYKGEWEYVDGVPTPIKKD